MPTAQDLITALNLRPLPREGGYYRETYRSSLALPAAALPGCYGRDKAAATAIFYLLTPDTFSCLHRLPTDEIYHFYLGDPVHLLQLLPAGSGRTVVLGPEVLAGQSVQAVVPAGVWQGSFLEPGGDFALLGTTMGPGFDFADFEEGERGQLIARYPEFADLVRRLTRDDA